MNRLIREGSPNVLSPEHGELSILLGDGISAANVVTALLKFIKEVTENGIIVGYEDDNVLIERIDGTVAKVPMQ